MIQLLAAFGAAFHGSYSLSAPFEKTNLSEIGDWTMCGSAVRMKSFLRMTASASANKYGAVCIRTPCSATGRWSLS